MWLLLSKYYYYYYYYFSLSHFVETFAVALDISKAFDRVWHKALLSKLPSYGFYLTLCSFSSSFLSGRSISAVVDGQCSIPKPINSNVPQGSVLSHTLFLLFINDLSLTNCPIHSMSMTPLSITPCPLTNDQIYRNCRYQGMMLQKAWPQTFLLFLIGVGET